MIPADLWAFHPTSPTGTTDPFELYLKAAHGRSWRPVVPGRCVHHPRSRIGSHLLAEVLAATTESDFGVLTSTVGELMLIAERSSTVTSRGITPSRRSMSSTVTAPIMMR